MKREHHNEPKESECTANGTVGVVYILNISIKTSECLLTSKAPVKKNFTCGSDLQCRGGFGGVASEIVACSALQKYLKKKPARTVCRAINYWSWLNFTPSWLMAHAIHSPLFTGCRQNIEPYGIYTSIDASLFVLNKTNNVRNKCQSVGIGLI